MKKRSKGIRQRSGVARALAGVDWPRELHRAAIIVRQLRGDRREDIQADHYLVEHTSDRLEALIVTTMRHSIGCQLTPACTCLVCIYLPISGTRAGADNTQH